MIVLLALAVILVCAIAMVAVGLSRSPEREAGAPVTAPEHRNRGPPARRLVRPTVDTPVLSTRSHNEKHLNSASRAVPQFRKDAPSAGHTRPNPCFATTDRLQRREEVVRNI